MLLFISTPLLFAAETPNTQVILTWHANNFYPADYTGKAHATPNTPITISAEALVNNKFVDTASGAFTWYVNDKIKQKNIIGLKEFTFTANGQTGDDIFVRVTIMLNKTTYIGSLRIPLQPFRVVLDAPFLNTILQKESTVTLRAIPYFFNISSLADLIFKWKINDGAREETKEPALTLKIGTPQTNAQKTLTANIFVQNNVNLFEFVQDTKNFFIQ